MDEDSHEAKKYAIIQFTSSDGGSVSIVNSQWLTPRRCEVYWPPIKGSKAFEKILHQDTSPTDNWKLYGVQRVFYETESLNEAKRKLKLSEFTSDLDTAEEETSKKRPTKRTKRYISGSESENEDTHARPPPVKKTFLSRLSITDTTDRQVEEARRQDQQKSPPAPENVTNYILNEHSTLLKNVDNLPLLSTSSSVLQGLEHDLGQTNSSTTWFEGTPRRRIERNYASIIKTSPLASPSCSTALTGFQSQVLSLLTTIKIQNEQMLEILKQNKYVAAGTLTSEFKFPLKNVEELMANEILLVNKENYDNLVSYLKSHGGRDVSGKVPRAMKFCMSDELAAEYNFYGKKSKTTNKKAFCTLRLRDCIVESVVGTTPNATAKCVEDCIKIWLKHAPERIKKTKNDGENKI